MIEWTETEGRFKITDKDLLTEFWATTKIRKRPMTYEHLSRSIRSYYKHEIITKAPKQFEYNFGFDIKSKIGYSSLEIREKLKRITDLKEIIYQARDERDLLKNELKQSSQVIKALQRKKTCKSCRQRKVVEIIDLSDE